MALNNSNLVGIVSNSPRTRAARTLKQWVLDGRLPAGERLPAEIRLASKLNVSRSTIRLALSDLEKEGVVSSDVRRRVVLDRIKPNRTFLADAIALITDAPDDFFEREKLHGTWHSNFVHTGAVDAIRAAGYDVLNIHPERIAGDLIQRLILQQPRGVLLMRQVMETPSGSYLPQALHEANVPFVVYGGWDRHQDAQKSFEFDTVSSDHESGAYELTKWLISLGRRRILRLWRLIVPSANEKHEWLVQRDKGYERAMREAGLKPLPPLEYYTLMQPHESETQEFGLQVRIMAGHLIEHLHGPKPIDAIMPVSDSVLPMVSSALKIYDLKPNRDITVVGYDNMWQDLFCQRHEPIIPAATVDKKNLQIGRELMNLLQQRIKGELPPQSQRRLVKPELIILQKP